MLLDSECNAGFWIILTCPTHLRYDSLGESFVRSRARDISNLENVNSSKAPRATDYIECLPSQEQLTEDAPQTTVRHPIADTLCGVR